MLEPSAPPPGPLPEPKPVPPPVSSDGRALRLLAEVRAAQARALWTQGLLLGLIVALVFLVAGSWVGASHARVGLGVLVSGGLFSFAVLAWFGVVLPRRKVGDDARTAKLLAERLPELNLDLLAAVELSKALGRTGEDFSPELARAFLRDVDLRAAKLSVQKLIDQRPTQRAAMSMVATVFVVLTLLVVQGKKLREGFAAAVTPAEKTEPSRRQPITGDVELTYRYPAHTGLEPRTIAGSTGDVSAPTGTEVTFKTRADRDVEAAALIFGPAGTRVPLRVDKRELIGSFVVNESGVFHVAFLSKAPWGDAVGLQDGTDPVAEGPDQSVTAEVDQPPQARISAPVDNLELDPKKQVVTVKFDASDDYGLTTLDLVFTPVGGKTQRVSLKPDDGRTTRGSYQWDLAPLALNPGQIVTYALEATDNDAVKGNKKGTSTTMRLKLYSSAEHRREALQKAEVLWTRLIDHLADRMEGPDRAQATNVPPSKGSVGSGLDAMVTGKPVDERGTVLATDFIQLAHDLNEEQDPPQELLAAMQNVGTELRDDVGQVSTNRNFLLRLSGRIAAPNGKTQFVDPRAGSYTQDLQRRVSISIETDIKHSEKNVLYLEALLDRARLDAIRELTRQLRDDRQELSKLLDEYKNSPDPENGQRLLDQMDALKQRMDDLQKRIAELSSKIHDDFMNAEALQEMNREFDMNDVFADMEKLIREGKADEALRRMQEFSMQMDQFLENLDRAEERAEQQMDPELAQQFTEFQDNLQDTIDKQDQLSEKTRQLRDKYRAAQKERIAKQGEALKKELKEKLAELEKSWSQGEQRYGAEFKEKLREAQQSRANVGQSLEANDFDLASEAAESMEKRAWEMSSLAQEMYRWEDSPQNPPEYRREARQNAEKYAKDAKKAAEISSKLRDLFPQPGQQMSEADRQQMNELSRQQKQLQNQAAQLQQQMDDINERAPIFNQDSMDQAQQAGQRMQGAGEKLQGKDPGRGFGEQQGALQSLRGLQQSMGESGNKGKGGIPLPMRGKRGGRGTSNEKVEIPDEDPNAAPREFRKDVMDAMKQGQPDRYKEQNKKYYEELVK
ncbi:MAG: DUF4175 domain-containing protein [Archangium sp.]|nr:DUF4175 domain-containing protein [Archangium sp.]